MVMLLYVNRQMFANLLVPWFNNLVDLSFHQCSPASTPQLFSPTNGPSAMKLARSLQLSLDQTRQWSLLKVRP